MGDWSEGYGYGYLAIWDRRLECYWYGVVVASSINCPGRGCLQPYGMAHSRTGHEIPPVRHGRHVPARDDWIERQAMTPPLIMSTVSALRQIRFPEWQIALGDGWGGVEG